MLLPLLHAEGGVGQIEAPPPRASATRRRAARSSSGCSEGAAALLKCKDASAAPAAEDAIDRSAAIAACAWRLAHATSATTRRMLLVLVAVVVMRTDEARVSQVFLSDLRTTLWIAFQHVPGTVLGWNESAIDEGYYVVFTVKSPAVTHIDYSGLQQLFAHLDK